MKWRYRIVAAATLLVGIFIFLNTTGPVRFYGGDIVVVIFLYSVISLVLQAPPSQKAGAVFLIALVIEVSQIFIHLPNDLVSELILGSSFDAYDIVAYVVGLILAVSVDSQLSKPKL